MINAYYDKAMHGFQIYHNKTNLFLILFYTSILKCPHPITLEENWKQGPDVTVRLPSSELIVTFLQMAVVDEGMS